MAFAAIARSANTLPPKLRQRRWFERGESKGWVVSLLVHFVLLMVLAWLIGPADFGGTGTRLVIRIVDGTDASNALVDLKPVPIDVTAEVTSPPESAPQPSPVVAAKVKPKPAAKTPIRAPVPKPHPNRRSVGKIGGSNSPGGHDGNHGSFFGLSAEGRDFVYVLDMSGSMDGHRFARASEELLRSVSGLQSSQRFYVMLFSDSTRHMFGSESGLARSVPATRENKQQLAYWLQQTKTKGGTDPRDALHTALSMHPSAVFMLSDGEFNGFKKQKSTNVFGANTDAFAIVESIINAPPIHAIAFMDRSSCKNMRRLAAMTDGDYRFIGKEMSAQATSRAVDDAIKSLKRNDLASTGRLLDRCKRTLNSHKGRGAECRRLASELTKHGKMAIENREWSVAVQHFAWLLQIDRDGSTILSYQHRMAEWIQQMCLNADVHSDDEAWLVDLSAAFQENPGHVVWRSMLQPMLNKQLELAERYQHKSKPVHAVRVYQSIVEADPRGSQAEASRDAMNDIAANLLSTSEKIATRGGAMEHLRFLKSQRKRWRGTPLVDKFLAASKTPVISLLRENLAAQNANDRRRIRESARRLSAVLRDDEPLRKFRAEYLEREKDAAARVRQAFAKSQKKTTDSRSALQAVVRDFPETFAARHATDLLERSR